MNDQELDNLIRESIERSELLEQVNNRVMTNIRRTARRNRIRTWARITAFAFGIPMVLFAFVLLTSHLLHTGTLLEKGCICLAATTLVIALAIKIDNFSLRKV